MRFYLISDDLDTIIGMRLAGIEGAHAETAEKAQCLLREAIAADDIGIVLMNEHLASLCQSILYEYKSKLSRPLIVEIPNSDGSARSADSITKYVRDAIGVKL